MAEELAKRGHDLFLVASDARDLDAMCRHLSIVHGIKAVYRDSDLATIEGHALRQEVLEVFPKLSNLFVIAGLARLDDVGQLSADGMSALVGVNFLGPLAVINAFLDHFLQHPEANVVGIGTVAAARGRRRNMVYASSKRGLEFYFEALRHLVVSTGLAIQFYRVGFLRTHTRETWNEPGLPLTDPAWVANRIASRLGRSRPIAYLPGWLRVVMSIFSSLPWFIFKKLKA
jgi:short-subunit dehydrogenase